MPFVGGFKPRSRLASAAAFVHPILPTAGDGLLPNALPRPPELSARTEPRARSSASAARRSKVALGSRGGVEVPLGGPGNQPYSKRGVSAGVTVLGFQWQRSAIDCEPTQVGNLIEELGRRHAYPPISQAVSAVRPALPAALTGPSWARAVRSLGRRLPGGYRVMYRLAPEARWADVERVVNEDECSMPLIGVSKEYWAEVSDAPPNEGDMDHALIVLECAGESCSVFDSYAAMLSKSTHARLDRSRTGPNLGVISVATVNLTRYWAGARVSKHLFWVERFKLKGRQLTLTEPGEPA